MRYDVITTCFNTKLGCMGIKYLLKNVSYEAYREWERKQIRGKFILEECK